MSTTLHFLEGPLFRVAILLFALGFLRRGVLWLLRKRRASSGGTEEIPLRPASPLHTVATAAMYTGLVLIGVFLADHVVAWAGDGSFPVLPHGVVDVLTIVTMVALVVSFGIRAYFHRPPQSVSPEHRHLVLLWFSLLMGYFASHPEGSPIAWETALGLHVLTACLFLGTSPFVRTGRVSPDRSRRPARERRLEEVSI